MRVLRIQKKKTSTLVLTTLGITTLGLLVTGAIVGSSLFLGAGVAVLLFLCVAALGLQRSRNTSYV